MKYSKQRELILEAVRSHPIHPTADTVYGILRAEYPNLSLGTVYRNLNCLAAEGKIAKLTMPMGGDRFDGTTAPHYHMLCETCGGVTDCPIDVMSGFEDVIYRETGFAVRGHEMIMTGECAACAAGEKLA